MSKPIKRLRRIRQHLGYTLISNMWRFMKQREPFIDSMTKTTITCIQVKEERVSHNAIEFARNTKVYYNDSKFIDAVIINQGREEYTQ